jgi:hypothetical protein
MRGFTRVAFRPAKAGGMGPSLGLFPAVFCTLCAALPGRPVFAAGESEEAGGRRLRFDEQGLPVVVRLNERQVQLARRSRAGDLREAAGELLAGVPRQLAATARTRQGGRPLGSRAVPAARGGQRIAQLTTQLDPLCRRRHQPSPDGLTTVPHAGRRRVLYGQADVSGGGRTPRPPPLQPIYATERVISRKNRRPRAIRRL